MTLRFLTTFKVEGATTADFAFDLARVLGRRELVAGSAVQKIHITTSGGEFRYQFD